MRIDDVTITRYTGIPVNYCQTAPNSVGTGALMGHSGSTSIAQNDLTLLVSGCPPGQPGIFYLGDDGTQVPFGDGFRCVAGNTERLLPSVLTDATGGGSYELDVSALPLAGLLLPGTTWNFQFWYRDPGHLGTGFNLSDGLRIRFCP